MFHRIKTTDAAKLQDEYAKLVEGLQESLSDASDTDAFMGNPGWMLSSSFKFFFDPYRFQFFQTICCTRQYQEISERLSTSSPS
jgi:hypothetical protein